MKKILVILMIISSFICANTIQDKHGNVYKTVKSPYTGKIWLDRNLGAKRVCKTGTDKQCFGDYFQWGRDSDGHEKENSYTTPKISVSNTPDNPKFIKNSNSLWDWRKTKNDKLWQGTNGINNPCPKDFRVPTKDEITVETIDQGVNNNYKAYKNFLKLPSAGFRWGSENGILEDQFNVGYLWSSSIKDSTVYRLYFSSHKASWWSADRINGLPVRCIKD